MIAIMSENIAQQIIKRAEQSRLLEKGAFLFHEGDLVRSVFVIQDGLVELTRHQLDGAPVILQRATDGAVLAEASVYSDVYHCAALVALPSTVFQLPKPTFLTCLREDRHFSELWSMHLAREVHAARYRSEILSRKTVSDRLDGWMAWYENKLPEKGQWKSVAEQIGVSPEALYRELARRRQ